MSEGAQPGRPAFDGRWRSRWIWSRPPDIDVDRTGRATPADGASAGWVLLRRTFSLEDVPADAPARAFADSRYVLWVNGREVSRGPVRANPRRAQHDVLDLAPALRPGRNALAVLARHLPGPTAWWMPAPTTYGLGGGAFTFEARVDGAGPDGWIVSDGSWRCLAAAAWTTAPGSGIGNAAAEICDGRALPAGWTDTDFDDEGWADAVELTPTHLGWNGSLHPPSAPYGALPARATGQLGGPTRRGRPCGTATVADDAELLDDPVEQVGADLGGGAPLVAVDGAFPVVVGGGAPAVLVVDLGEQTAGILGVAVEAPAGARLDALAAEAVDGRGVPKPLDQHTGFRYVARGGGERFEAFDPVGLRFLALSVRSPEPVTVTEVAVRERTAPRPDGPWFSCSDPLLERIWAVGRRTVDLCAQDAYVDCPSREQRAWTGDAVVHQLVDLTTNPDWRLACANLDLGASPRPDGMLPLAAGGDLEATGPVDAPDWALHWVHGLHEVARYTGDDALVRRLLPVAERVLQWFTGFQAADGLLADVTGWLVVDWAAVSTQGRSAVLNALWGRALREFQKLADQVGDHGRARWAGELWVQLRKDFQQFWDPDRRLYVDHIVDGRRMPAVSQHANAAAVAARLTRGVDPGRLVEEILDRDRLVSASWLVPGREARLEGPGDIYAGAGTLVTGPPEPWWDVEHQIVASQPFFRYVVHDAVAVAERADLIPALCRDWAPLLERSPTTWSETWFGGSHCHGWSSTPTRDLVQHTLGITPAAPGYARARVAPALGDLDWARGAAPTPHGLLSVDVRPGGITVSTPVETTVVHGGIDTRLPPGDHELEA